MPVVYVFVLCMFAPPPSIFTYKEGSFVKEDVCDLSIVPEFL